MTDIQLPADCEATVGGSSISFTITAEFFRECVGHDPENDDLERCNCPLAGTIAHMSCGWNITARRPQFMCGLNQIATGGNLVWAPPHWPTPHPTAPQREPLTPQQQLHAENIAKAVSRMSGEGIRGAFMLGAKEWEA